MMRTSRIFFGWVNVFDPRLPFPETVAAIDLGSNSFHLIVARTNGGELAVVDRMREMVQLASGLDANRRLTREARDRALDCLGRFGQRVRHMPAGAVRAVGTNTLRSAQNVGEFLPEAEERLGHAIETISGVEEARLIYLGVVQSTPATPGQRLVLDIGGGSTELIVGDGAEPLRMESLFIGCVSMSRRWFGDGAIDEKCWNKARVAALQEFEPIRAAYRKIGWTTAIGGSGTIRAAHAVVTAAGWSKTGITFKSLRRLRDAMLEAGHVDALEFEGLNPARRAVFPGGLAILFAAFEALGTERMLHSDGALREGLLFDLLGRIREEDARSRSVGALGDRYHVDWQQAGRVECTALGLLAQVADDWNLATGDARRLLSWAARLHEIGLDIAHASYHKHGQYIIDESELLGFSREEQSRLAALVRAHRRKFPVATIKSMRRRRRMTERLAILLRLSVLLHRSRNPDPPPELTLGARKDTLRLELPSEWLEAHPLTRADLQSEADYLAEIGIKLAIQ